MSNISKMTTDTDSIGQTPSSLVCQKNKMLRDLDHAHTRSVCPRKTNSSWANPCTKFDDAIFGHSRKISGGVKF